MVSEAFQGVAEPSDGIWADFILVEVAHEHRHIKPECIVSDKPDVFVPVARVVPNPGHEIIQALGWTDCVKNLHVTSVESSTVAGETIDLWCLGIDVYFRMQKISKHWSKGEEDKCQWNSSCQNVSFRFLINVSKRWCSIFYLMNWNVLLQQVSKLKSIRQLM